MPSGAGLEGWCPVSATGAGVGQNYKKGVAYNTPQCSKLSSYAIGKH